MSGENFKPLPTDRWSKVCSKGSVAKVFLNATGGLSIGNTTGISLEQTTGSTVIANVISSANSSKALNSTASAGTTEIKNSCLYGTSTFGNTTNTNNITTDPKVTSDGFLQPDSPCINTGAWISGAGGNQSGEADRFGFKIYGQPNMGIDQKTSAPIITRAKRDIGTSIR